MNNDLTFFTNEPERNLNDRFNKILKRDTQFFDALVGYFRASGFYLLQDALNNVEKTRILIGINTDEQVLKITSEGKNAYVLTKDVMPGILKLRADSVFKKEFSNIEEASSVIAEFTPKNENDYTVTLKIVENNETIFEVKTYAGSRDRAKKIVENWKNNANTIYPNILNILFEGK